MIKKHLKVLIITSIIILLPAVAGLILWNKLPEVLPTHWGFSDDANGYSGKVFGVLGMPLILLAVQWLLAFLSGFDRKSHEQNPKAYRVVFWIIPAISLIMGIITYFIALDVKFKFSMFFSLLFGLMFIGIGNYLPKVRRNFTMGIKIKPLLESEANWNATHRMAGKLWVVCGIVMLLTAFLPEIWFAAVMITVVLVAIIVPVIYAYRFRATHPEDAVNTIDISKEVKKAPLIVTAVVVPIILIIVGIIMFTGDVHTEIMDDSFSVSSTYYGKITVDFADVESLNFVQSNEPGIRTYGFQNTRLLLGSFRNEEFGNYTRYSYTGNGACIVIKIDGKTLVIGGRTEAETKEIYDSLYSACEF
ncbi:MAG: SdpI family protein [Acutalibacteraceae bacterium]|nr:SdpI family protein [Acutalibacteraceae bacterium]